MRKCFPVFVCSWMNSGFVGRPKGLMTGLIRQCTSTDLQVSPLNNNDRCRPWDHKFHKRVLSEIYQECDRVLVHGVVATEEMTGVCVSTVGRSNLTVLYATELVFLPRRGLCTY